MKYLILDGPPYPLAYKADYYRGTDRKSPLYVDEAPRDSEVNRLFEWCLEETYRKGYVEDLVRAHRYCELSNLFSPDQRFEIVEICRSQDVGEQRESVISRFRYSLSGCGDSLVLLNLLPGPSPEIPVEPILVLSELIRRFFCPRLNDFGLFEKFDDASYCRQAMIALQSFHPDLYEGGDLSAFKVTAVYLALPLS